MIRNQRPMNRALFLAGVSLACLATSPALAQTASPTAATPADDTTTVIVTGTRASLARALDVKRRTLGVVDSIAAEDIGKLPDQNVAESLQRIPGVSINRVQGEGRFVTVRGFGPEFNTVLLNGRVLATDNDGREFSFDVLPSELISGADVYKSSAANFQEGGIGSTINIRTARPTDRAGVFMAGSVAGKYDSGSENTTPSASVLFSRSNEDRTFGVLGSLVYDKRDARVYRFSTDGWLAHQDLDFDKDGTIDLADVAVDRGAGQSVDTSSRERIGGTLAIDWKPSDRMTVKLDALYTQYKVDSRVFAMGYFSDPADIISATANEHRTLTHYVRSNTGSLATDNTYNAAPRDAKTFQLAGNVEYKPSDRTTITTDLSYSKARNDGRDGVPVMVIGSRNTGLNPTWNLRPDQPTPLVTNVYPATDTDRARGHFSIRTGSDITDEVTQLRIDGSHRFDGVFNSLHFGVLASDRTKTTKAYQTPGAILCAYCGYYATLPAGLAQVFDSGQDVFLDSPGLTTKWLTFDPAALTAYYASDAAISQMNPANQAAFRAAFAANGNSYRGVLSPLGSGAVAEKSFALYLQGEFAGEISGMPWDADTGLRWVSTDLVAEGSSQQLLSVTTQPGDNTQLNYTLSDPVPVRVKNNYSYLLPSATFRLNFTDKLVGRASVSRTLTRPTLTNLGVSQSYTLRPPQSFYASGGNPNLKPYLAWNTDLALDYYFNRGSYVSVAGFYKKVSNFVSLVTQPREILGYTFQDTRPTNAQEAEIEGVEAAFQYTFDFLPAPFDGLGLSANYTKVDSSVSFDPSLSTQVFNVEGLSDSANLVVFYEKGPIQLRAAYNWRAKFLQRTFGKEGQPENVDAYGQLDMQASYKITPHLTAFVEGLNLTDQKTRSFAAYEERLLTLEEPGKRITVGVRASF